MKKQKKTSKISVAIGILCAVLFVLLFAITFIDSDYIPTWSQLFFFTQKADLSDQITFLNVGNSNAVLIQSNGRNAMVDCGGESGRVRRKLLQRNVENLDFLLLTDWKPDCMKASEALLSDFTVWNIITPDLPEAEQPDFESCHSVLTAAADHQVNRYIAKQAMHMDVGNFRVSVLQYNRSGKNGDTSIVAMAKCRQYRFLLAENLSPQGEKFLLKSRLDLDCDVMTVANHGDKESTGEALIRAASPDFAVISVGKENENGLPHRTVIHRLEDQNAEVLRTDISGDITFVIDEDQLLLKTAP